MASSPAVRLAVLPFNCQGNTPLLDCFPPGTRNVSHEATHSIVPDNIFSGSDTKWLTFFGPSAPKIAERQ